MNINGLDSKALAEFQFLILRANDDQLNGLLKIVESEIIKRKMIEDFEEKERMKQSNSSEFLLTGFNFHDVFDKNKNKRLNR